MPSTSSQGPVLLDSVPDKVLFFYVVLLPFAFDEVD
jgi:hypothetical protein